MNAIEKRQYDMLLRVRDFGDSHGHLFPSSSVARQNFETVAAAVKELDAQELVHMAASAAARAARKTTAREALLARLQAMSRTARVLVAAAPGLDQQFQVPNPATDQVLLTTGRKFARDAGSLSSQFIAQGMPEAFVAELDGLVGSFERALRDRGVGREALRAARASTKTALWSGMAASRSLNAIVTNHLPDDSVARTVWEGARRIVYAARAKSTDATRAPAPAPAVPESPTGSKAA